jgi:hypothetical protein
MSWRVLAAIAVSVVVVASCDSPPPSPSPTGAPGRPGIQIDPSWTATNGQWTFTGRVDPQGDPTDVVLEIGPGPITLRQFDRTLPVSKALVDAGPLTITTSAIPDIDEICVRFSATNGVGTSSSTPLCFAHDLPSFSPDVGVDPPATTFTAPAFGTVTLVTAATYSVTWTETEGGSGLRSRSLQRQVAPFAAGGCGAFNDDGAPAIDESPLAVSGLLAGNCYQWIQTLRDTAGIATSTTSGILRVAP